MIKSWIFQGGFICVWVFPIHYPKVPCCQSEVGLSTVTFGCLGGRMAVTGLRWEPPVRGCPGAWWLLGTVALVTLGSGSAGSLWLRQPSAVVSGPRPSPGLVSQALGWLWGQAGLGSPKTCPVFCRPKRRSCSAIMKRALPSRTS